MDRRLDFSLSELIAVAPRSKHYRQKIHDALRSYFEGEGQIIIDRKKNSSGILKGEIQWASIYDDLINNDEFLSIVQSRDIWKKNLIDNSSRSPPGGHDRYHMCLLYWMHLPAHSVWNTSELNKIGDNVCIQIFHMSATEKVAKIRAAFEVIQNSQLELHSIPSRQFGPFSPPLDASGESDQRQGWWNAAVSDALQRAELKAVVFDTAFDIVRVSPRKGRPLQKISLDEEFALSWTAAEDGYALSIQKYAGKWYPLWACIPVLAGPITIPPQSEHQRFVETDHDGPHTFVVIFSKAEIHDWGKRQHLNYIELERFLSVQGQRHNLRLFATEVIFLS